MSIKKKFFMATLSFGIIMGLIFPVYASFFVDFHSGMFGFFLAGCIGAGLFVGLFSFFLANFIIFKVFRNMSTVLNEMSEGDLSKRIEVSSNDEIGFMVTYFNYFVTELQNIIGSIAKSTQTLVTFVSEFSLNSNHIFAKTKEIGSQSATVAASSAQASENVTHIASSIQEISSSVATVASSIEEMSSTINEISLNCQKEYDLAASANEQAQSTNVLMRDLEESASEIGKIVDIIKDIADKINLLALNAYIEAARAGDAGKGFAVVANEVKELAKQTARATGKISKQISHMRSNSLRAVKSIEDITQTISEVNIISHTIVRSVEGQSSAVREIAQSISGVNSAGNQVTENVQESNKGLTEISGNITELNQAIETISDKMSRLDRSINDITGLAEELKETVARFS